MKRFILICLMFLFGCAVNPSSQYQKALSSSIRIEDPSGLGSGVIINPHCALTARHVVSGSPDQVAITQDGKEHHVIKSYKAEFSDLAVICVDDEFMVVPIQLRDNMPPQYAPIFVIGNPLGVQNVLTIGNYQGDDNITAPIAWGNSGGGVFDETGALIGIVVAIRIKRIENYVFAFPHLGSIVTIRDIIPFLEQNHILYSSAN